MIRTENTSKEYPTVFFAPIDNRMDWSIKANLWNKSVSWPTGSQQSIKDAIKFRDALTAAIEEAKGKE